MSKSGRLLRVLRLSVPFTCAIPSFCHCRGEATVSSATELAISVHKDTFVRAEPVPIRVEISNRSEKVVEVVSTLEPEYSVLRFRVTDPEGKTSTPLPGVLISVEGYETMALNGGEKLTYTALLLFGVVDGAGRFVFNERGKYTVQAVSHAEGTRKAVSSEPIVISVVGPQGVDSQAHRLFMGEEQGEFAAGYGAAQAAIESLRRILREYPTSAYAPYAAYYLGSYYQRHEEYKQSIELFERILKEYRDFPVWADVMYQLAIAYRETGRKDKARECIRQLISKDPSHLAARRARKLLSKL